MTSIPLYVVYRLDTIYYKIQYDKNYEPVKKKEKTTINIDKTIFYIVLVQKKEGHILLNLFDTGLTLKKYKCENYDNMLDFLDCLDCIIVLKNVKKEMTYLQEHEIEIYEKMKDKKLYCFDNYLKYSLCLPIFIQGKISKRYRIPTIDEYIQKKELSIITFYKSECTKQRLFFKEIINDFLAQIGDYYKNIPKILEWTDLKSLLDYLICTGIETHNICYIAGSLANKRNVEKSIDYNIVFLVLDQYLRNPKNYDFYILENRVNSITNKFIMISPVPFP
jgi:hypothetical protein